MSPDQKPRTVWDGVPLLAFVIVTVGIILALFATTNSRLVHLCHSCYYPMSYAQGTWSCARKDCPEYLVPCEGKPPVYK